MSYYPTIEEDLQRAKWLLAREPDNDALPLLYKLLESFVAEIERLRGTLGRVEDLIDIALPRFNWGASALDAEAIALLNEVPLEVKRVLKGEH
jgi:hypothetical protein